jgi:two-component system, response regulator, stage 0 sporulation protein F
MRMVAGVRMKKIVLVDDDINLMKVYKFFLSKEGYDVDTYYNGHEALQFVSSGQPADLFILDVELPDMSGLNLMEKIRENAKYSQTPIIISSAYEQYRNDFTSWLASDYLVKQPDLGELEAKVRNLLH